MLKLHGKVEIKIDQIGNRENQNRLHLLSTNEKLPLVLRKDRTFLLKSNDAQIPDGFRAYFVPSKFVIEEDLKNVMALSDEYNYLDDGDIVAINIDKSSIRVLYRKKSKHNSFLVTERCNHFCLMCSQPPKDIDDGWIIEEIKEAITLIDKDTQTIGFTGGEPTLLGDKFLELLQMMKNYLPRTSVHILSNGRKFTNIEYTKRYAEINHPDMMIGIPIYSDSPAVHDYIVQAKGAFHETIQGVINLKRFNQKVEIRIVLHKQSIPTLVSLCHYIARNLLFVDHVALMGLEMMGFTRLNLDDLWIDPFNYKDTLSEAVAVLASYGLTTSVYNHQLCLVNPDVEPYYVKSISDWKNEYLSVCDACVRKSECGGFFSSNVKYKYSERLTAFSE